MIWFFGTSHTAGTCHGKWHQIYPEHYVGKEDFLKDKFYKGNKKVRDSIKYIPVPWPRILAKNLGIDYLNFASPGANNLEIYSVLRTAVLDTSLPDPDIIIIEPRNFWDFTSFPAYKHMYNKASRSKSDTWIKSDTEYKEDLRSDKYLRTHLLIYRAFKTMKDTSVPVDHIRRELKDYHRKDGEDLFSDSDLDQYEDYFGEWYDKYVELCIDTMNSGHADAELHFEQEIASMINIAESRAKRVGYMIWDWRVQDQGLEAVDKRYKIVEPCVKQYLKRHHNHEFEISCRECPDDHLGPTVQPIIANKVEEWINAN